jgi:4-diphosphocytidyl-2-C-methyl-D-erythritol kinase
VVPDAALAIAAPAKVNLFLHVLGRRADGYHRLDSLIAFAAAGDRIEIAPASDLSLAIEGPFASGLSAGEDNLVLRAARALATVAGGQVPGAAIRLVKNLPVASGIGGGSSDAAATLKGLNAFWRIDAGDDVLARIGLTLGADVPVCLFGRPARVSGIGETIAPAPTLPPFGVVLVNPGIPVPTAAVFKALAGRYSGEAPALPMMSSARDAALWLGQRHNDLAGPAITLAPAIREVLDRLGAARECLLARLSGSGATCFALFADAAAAVTAARDIGASQPSWWVTATRFTDASPTPGPLASSG